MSHFQCRHQALCQRNKLQGSHSYASVKFHDFSMTLYTFFHDYFTRWKCKIYEKCCKNHHTRPGHTFTIVTISKYDLDLQRVLSVSFIVKIFVNNVVRSVFHKHEVLQNLQNKFVQIWVFHDFFHDLLNSMTFPWPIIFHDFSMTFPWPVIFHDFSMTVGTLKLNCMTFLWWFH